jgi:hypothetical protein
MCENRKFCCCSSFVYNAASTWPIWPFSGWTRTHSGTVEGTHLPGSDGVWDNTWPQCLEFSPLHSSCSKQRGVWGHGRWTACSKAVEPGERAWVWPTFTTTTKFRRGLPRVNCGQTKRTVQWVCLCVRRRVGTREHTSKLQSSILNIQFWKECHSQIWTK